MNSIRTRLVTGISVMVVLAAAAAGFLTYSWTFEEALELQDAMLWQVSDIVVAVKAGTTPALDSNHEKDTRVTIEELAARPGHLTSYPAGLSPLPQSLSDGMQNVNRGVESWRVLVRTREDGSRVAISQPVEARDEIARGGAIRSMIPIVILMLCLIVLVGAITRYSFRSIVVLSHQLDVSLAGHKERLSTDGVPSELLPFITSINRMLERVDFLFDQQARFIANAAHELRTPIAALSLQTENLRTAKPEDFSSRLELVQNGVRRIVRLIDQLLSLARLESSRSISNLSVSLASLADAATEVVADYSAKADEKNVDLGFDVLQPISVNVDATAIRILIRNLIENALRHTPTGGHIDLAVKEEPPWAVFEVRDSGPGVIGVDLEEIRQPFVRGSNAIGEGNGLGLAIVQSVVDLHGGKIEMQNENAPRSGLRVTIRFPAARIH